VSDADLARRAAAGDEAAFEALIRRKREKVYWIAYRIVGTKGHLHADPAYEYAEGLEYTLTIGGRTTRRAVGKRDQFAPELVYFSDCILSDRQPEPSGEEGMQDVRIVQALYRSAQTGRSIAIPPFEKRYRPTSRQRITRPGVRKPALVKVQSASRD